VTNNRRRSCIAFFCYSSLLNVRFFYPSIRIDSLLADQQKLQAESTERHHSRAQGQDLLQQYEQQLKEKDQYIAQLLATIAEKDREKQTALEDQKLLFEQELFILQRAYDDL
jgi:hypothetical protein